MTTPEIPPANLESAISFIRNNRVPVKIGVRCIDGRYQTDDQNEGYAAFPGGDSGLAMGFMAYANKHNLNIEPERVVEILFGYRQSQIQPLSDHTDDHPKEADATGCGHVQKSIIDYEAYSLKEGQSQKMLNYTRRLKSGGSDINTVTLTGHHAEKRVIINTGEKFTIRHMGKDGEQSFVVDQGLLLKDIKGLVEYAKLTDPNAEAELAEIITAQLMATAKKIAHGLDIYTVNADEEGGAVTLVGKVE